MPDENPTPALWPTAHQAIVAGQSPAIPGPVDQPSVETAQKKSHGIPSKKNPPWWPTAEQKIHADAGCAHPDECRVIPPGETP